MEIPKAGDKLTTEHIDLIFEAVKNRQEKMDEPTALSLYLVMLNIGERFAPVNCINGEWSGVKQDIPNGEGVPLCPNGHPLTQGVGVTLGWVSDNDA